MSKRRLAYEINVVPYIDVMLVLLIIFMVTAPLLTAGVQVNLPNAQAQPMHISPENEPLILTVQADGNLYLNVGENPEQPISPEEVLRLASIVLKQRPQAPVAVRGDEAGDYGDVLRAMVLLQQAGAQRVGLLTDRGETRDDAAPKNGDEGEGHG
ncbi:MAG: protein TolR [Salinisphaera sp.]|nr:protein TolR [Salinisphaera sp.]MDN5938607.1 protein TolR [Salinisphaera sp.]